MIQTYFKNYQFLNPLLVKRFQSSKTTSSKKIISGKQNELQNSLDQIPTFMTKLSNRRLLQISGNNYFEILDKIVTCDLENFIENPKKGAVYTSLQNSRGSIISDAFMVKPITYCNKKSQIEQKYEEQWIDIPEAIIDSIVNHLSIYFNNKDLKIFDISQSIDIYSIYSVGNLFKSFDPKKGDKKKHKYERGDLKQGFYEKFDNKQIIEKSEDLLDNCSLDPRTSNMGYRLYTNSDKPSFYIENDNYVQKPIQVYDLFRYILNIPEGSEITGLDPFSCNFDFFNSIKLNKKAFFGQKKVSEDYLTRVIKKRLMNVIISKDINYLKECITNYKESFVSYNTFEKIFTESENFSKNDKNLLKLQETNFNGRVIYSLRNNQYDKIANMIIQQNGNGIAQVDYIWLDFDEIYCDKYGFYYAFTQGLWKDHIDAYIKIIENRQ